MKKFLLGTVALIAFAAPAAAADLAARPYTKAPPALIAVVYDWSGFYIGANGGWGSSRKCWDFVRRRCRRRSSLPKVAMTRPAAPSAVRSAIAGRPAPGCSASKRRATGPTSAAAMSSLFVPGVTQPHRKIDAFGLFTGQIGYAWNNVLLYVKGGAAVTGEPLPQSSILATGIVVATAERRPAGAARSASASNTASLRTGRSASSTITCSWATATTASSSTRPALPSRNDRISQDVDLVTARINYRFGGPVIAKY